MISMATLVPVDWHTENQRHLLAALATVRAAIERRIDPSLDEVQEESTEWSLEQPPALDLVCAAFGLSRFERDVLLLCAGVELDSSFPALCAAAHGVPERDYPTFGLALAALPDAHWSAITPDGALRRWRLIEVGDGPALTTSPLRIDERVLHHLTGTPCLDTRLASYLSSPPPLEPLPSSHSSAVSRLIRAWINPNEQETPAIALMGGSPSSRRLVAAIGCASLGLGLWVTNESLLPMSATDLDLWLRLWEREAALSPAALLIESEGVNSESASHMDLVARLAERTVSPIIVSGPEQFVSSRSTVIISLRRPEVDDQLALWENALGDRALELNGHLAKLTSQFTLDSDGIRDAVGAALLDDDEDLSVSLWDACRAQARPQMEGLAKRFEPMATWDDLVLPPQQTEMLREITIHARQRATVYEQWGWTGRGDRGLGITALFSGASGTGKTLAAEVIANELALDLYVVDLSQVVSKYIGETEKNLARIFNAAEGGGAVLLFDEADALFGKRSEVKDSHDRYANIEVSYLLQRMEAYRGLAILTTNMRGGLDTAFMRRLRFVIQFPFPDVPQRAEIWRRAFPAATPTSGLKIDRLAQLNVAGGNIRNIALHASFLAAGSNKPVGMSQLLRAARSEYAKLEKPLTESEIGGWM
jgi:ATPase family associated with various cellular activities (AAA)